MHRVCGHMEAGVRTTARGACDDWTFNMEYRLNKYSVALVLSECDVQSQHGGRAISWKRECIVTSG